MYVSIARHYAYSMTEAHALSAKLRADGYRKVTIYPWRTPTIWSPSPKWSVIGYDPAYTLS